MPKLQGRLPKGERNGFDRVDAAMIADPHAVHCVVAYVDCARITTNTDTGEAEPTARIVRVEVVRPEDVRLAASLMRNSLDERRPPTLPIEVLKVQDYELHEDEQRFIVDMETGEIVDVDDSNNPASGDDPSEPEALPGDLVIAAADLIVGSQSTSPSMLLKRLSVDESTLGRVFQALERLAIVGPGNDDKPREVFVAGEYLEAVLTRIRREYGVES